MLVNVEKDVLILEEEPALRMEREAESLGCVLVDSSLISVHAFWTEAKENWILEKEEEAEFLLFACGLVVGQLLSRRPWLLRRPTLRIRSRRRCLASVPL